MAQGKKYDDSVREQAHALLMVGNNAPFVAKQLNLPYSTVKTWELSLKKNGDEFNELRQKKKEEFIQGSWEVIDLAQTLLKRRLSRAKTSEDELDELVAEIAKLDNKVLTDSLRKALYAKVAAIKVEDIGKIAVVLGTLYDKQALANKEATAIVEGNINVKKFEDF